MVRPAIINIVINGTFDVALDSTKDKYYGYDYAIDLLKLVSNELKKDEYADSSSLEFISTAFHNITEKGTSPIEALGLKRKAGNQSTEDKKKYNSQLKKMSLISKEIKAFDTIPPSMREWLVSVFSQLSKISKPNEVEAILQLKRLPHAPSTSKLNRDIIHEHLEVVDKGYHKSTNKDGEDGFYLKLAEQLHISATTVRAVHMHYNSTHKLSLDDGKKIDEEIRREKN